MHFIDLKTQQDRIRSELDRRIAAVLEHGRYILGPEVAELEERLADYVGVKHCIGVSSGTDSLLIALMALEIGPGDEVITVPYTWISTAEMIVLAGAKPVFIDIDPDTWNLDPALLEAAITPRTKAIMPVGIYGQPPDMTAINEIAARHGNLPVIEDAAQSFGSTHHGRRSCGLSTIGSTSFFPSKPLGCYGDGGALFTDDDHLAQRMRQIRAHGQARKHHHPILGVNGRLDTLQAAIVLAKLDIFDEEVRLRQEVAADYERRMSGAFSADLRPPTSDLRLPQPPAAPSTPQAPSSTRGAAAPPHAPSSSLPARPTAASSTPQAPSPTRGEAAPNTSVYAQYTILHPERDRIAADLKAQGIPSVSYYTVPLHLQPVFADLGYQPGDFPVTEQVSNQCLSLPMSPWLSPEDRKRVAEAVLSAATVEDGAPRATGR